EVTVLVETVAPPEPPPPAAPPVVPPVSVVLDPPPPQPAAYAARVAPTAAKMKRTGAPVEKERLRMRISRWERIGEEGARRATIVALRSRRKSHDGGQGSSTRSNRP